MLKKLVGGVNGFRNVGGDVFTFKDNVFESDQIDIGMLSQCERMSH